MTRGQGGRGAGGSQKWESSIEILFDPRNKVVGVGHWYFAPHQERYSHCAAAACSLVRLPRLGWQLERNVQAAGSTEPAKARGPLKRLATSGHVLGLWEAWLCSRFECWALLRQKSSLQVF